MGASSQGPGGDPPQEPAQAAVAVTAVGAVVFDGEGRVLLVRRGRPPAAGTWSLPGGRVRPGEAIDHAIVREVLEETAIETRVACALGVVETSGETSGESFRFAIHEHLLVPLDPSARPRAGDDAADARWVPLPELAALGVTTAVLDVIAQANAARTPPSRPAS